MLSNKGGLSVGGNQFTSITQDNVAKKNKGGKICAELTINVDPGIYIMQNTLVRGGEEMVSLEKIKIRS